MSAITKELLASLRINKGIESIDNDIELLDQFMSHATGCGLESLDSASGRLIEQGLAERYSDYYQLGSGVEGIGNLLTTLKTAVGKLKGAFKGKKPEEIVAKPTADAVAAVKKQYNQSFWGGWKQVEAEVVKPTGLLALVQGGTWAEVKAQIEETISGGEASAKEHADGLVKYWDGVLPVFKKLQAEKDPAKQVEICYELIAYSENTKLEDAPGEFKAKNTGGTLPPLSESEANDAVTYLVDLLDRSKKIYTLTDQMYTVGIKDDDADGYLESVTDNKDAPTRMIYKCFGRPELTNELSGYVEEVRDYVFSAITGLEDWVNKSRS